MIKRPMVRFYVIANCQFESITLLLRHMVADAVVDGMDVTSRGVDEEAASNEANRHMEEADFIIIQPGGKGIFDDRLVRQRFPGKALVIAGLFFRGLHPDCCYVGAFEDRFQNPSLYHSVAVLDAYVRGVSEKAAVQSFNIENFERLGLLGAWVSSLDEMRRRDRAIDLPAAAFVEEYCREFCGFLSMNHPGLGLMHQYIAAALRQIGVSFRPMNLAAMADPLAAQDVLPVHDFIAEHYGLPYRTTQHWMIGHLGKKYLTREDYVRRCYEAYRKADPARLKIHSPVDLVAALRAQPCFAHLVDPQQPEIREA
ncbi:MAG: hypothetical protein KGI97_01725 [Alphaproteobacteria bacterium]|nr:hypothetical protein [Alphaproteobacteria bacterium]